MWKLLLKKAGYAAVTEAAWLRSDAPDKLKAFWNAEYPQMQDIESNLEDLRAAGYQPVEHFTLPESAWWDYYRAIEKRVIWKTSSYALATILGERSMQMQEKDSLFPTVDSHGRLECKEIWGGIRSKDIEVSAGKVIGSIYSAASEGGLGGDIYYFGVCKGDTITRLAIADVTGHGEAVSEISQYVYDALKTHM